MLFRSEQNLIIEVAGLRDQQAFGGDYMQRLESAEKAVQARGNKMIILDYYSYRKNPQAFYKYVCETFDFPYNPDDFWVAMKSEGFDTEKYLEIAKELVKKGAAKTHGERDKQTRIITQMLTKPKQGDELEKPQGYESVWDFKRETGTGLKWSDTELRKKIQTAWCQSTGANIKTLEKFKELYPEIPLAKSTIEKVKIGRAHV